MSENNNVEFTFDYNEAETVDRLISLEDTLDMLEQVHRHKFIAHKRTSDIAFVNDRIHINLCLFFNRKINLNLLH